MANDVYQLSILGSSAGQFFENVQHFASNETSGSDPVAAAAALVSGWIGNILAPYVDCLCVDSNVSGFKAKRINNGGGPMYATAMTPEPGVVAGTSATSATASLMMLPFTRSGKWYNGKMFIPGLSESVLAGNVIAPAQVSALGTLATTLIAGFTSSPFSFDPVVWSRVVSLPFIPYDIVVNGKVGIQRRRLLPHR